MPPKGSIKRIVPAAVLKTARTKNHFDVIVAGLGAMGSATVYHLAARGSRVLGLDRFRPPHDHGSSHGRTRIIREAYFEDPAYVPLVQRAYQLWAELEKRSRRRLFLQTGGVMVGSPEGVLIRGALRSALRHRLAHEVLSAGELRRRLPVFRPARNMVGVWEPRAGVLFPELAVEAHLEMAADDGAVLRFNEPVVSWEPRGQGVQVRTPNHSFSANRLVLAAGPWMPSLAQDVNLPLSVERQVLYWFEPRGQPAAFGASACPISIWQYGSRRFFYGFPDLGEGVKLALHHQGEPAQPDTVRREVDTREITQMRTLLRRFLPDAEGRLRETAVCLYTNAPDEHFILDCHPQHPQVLLASPCSGHGFKFSSVIGEILAMMALGQSPVLDVSLFRLSRFR